MSAPQPRLVVTRNGLPCAVQSLHFRAPEFGFIFHGRVAVPLPLPPGDPYVFRKVSTADRVADRSRTLFSTADRVADRSRTLCELCGKLRQSLFRAQIVERFPALSPFTGGAAFAVEPRTKKV